MKFSRIYIKVSFILLFILAAILRVDARNFASVSKDQKRATEKSFKAQKFTYIDHPNTSNDKELFYGYFFVEGNNGLWGVFEYDGNQILDFVLESTENIDVIPFDCGAFLFYDNEKEIYLNGKGDIALNFGMAPIDGNTVEGIKYPHCIGVLDLKTHGRGVLSPDGKMILSPRYDRVETKDNLCGYDWIISAQKGDVVYLYNPSGKLLDKWDFYSLKAKDDERLIVYWEEAIDNKSGDLFFPIEIDLYKNKSAYYSPTKYIALVDRNLKFIIPPKPVQSLKPIYKKDKLYFLAGGLLSEWTKGSPVDIYDDKGDLISQVPEGVSFSAGSENDDMVEIDGVKQRIDVPYVSKTAPALPNLQIVEGSVRFEDPNGFNVIESQKEYYIQLTVRNTGNSSAIGCSPKLSINSDLISIGKSESFDLPARSERKIRIPVKADKISKPGSVDFSIYVDEMHGFGTDKTVLSVNTRSFSPPRVIVSDYSVTGAASTTIQKKQPFDLQILVQNIAQGIAENVVVDIVVPDNVYIVDGESSIELNRIEPGETKSFVYSIVANNRFEGNRLPIKMQLREKHGKYAENKTIELSMSQPLAASKIVVDENARAQADIQIATLTSEIDRDIPRVEADNSNTFAVIIANETYNDVASVPFALNDGNIFRTYCTNTLGIPESNVRYVGNATRNDITRQLRWIEEVGKAYGSSANVIFYYSGHGVPSESDRTSYLMPVDGYYSDMGTNLSLDEVYSSLGKSGAGKVTVFLDACFSGSDRGDGMLMSARGVKIKAKQSSPSGSMVVFSASQADETAYPLESERHGLFTYFLLKKLRESKGDITLGELGDYLTEQVRRKSVVENSKPQTPAVLVSPAIGTSWRSLKLH